LYELISAMGVDQAPRGPLGGLSPPPVESILGIDTMIGKYAVKMQMSTVCPVISIAAESSIGDMEWHI
jgi:hypothetical protein